MGLVRSAAYMEICPACSSANYYDVDDPVDITGFDVEGLRCWACGNLWLTDGSEDCAALDEANIEDGRESL